MTPSKTVKAKKKSKGKKAKVSAASETTVTRSVSTTSDAPVSKKRKFRDDSEEATGGLKLLKRKCVTMKRISQRKSSRAKRVVLFNRKGTPCGKVATVMQSYIGVLARRKIPIIRSTWRTACPKNPHGVTAEEKDKIWQCVQGAFVIGAESKKVVLESAAARWREFKTRLTTKYIIPYLNEPEMLKFPPDDYRFINVDHWSTFVAERSCPKFLAKRAVQQEKRKKNKYPHRMSRKGYANLEEELSAALGLDDEEVSREDLWIEARKGPDGEFKDEDTKSIAEEISELKEKVKSGECIIDGADDVLSKALGPEHGGRVRGVGGFVTPSTYFHLPRRKRTTMQETIQKMLKEAVENERAFWVQKLAAIEARLPPGVGDGAGDATTVPVDVPATMRKFKSPISGQESCSHTTDNKADEVVVNPLEAKTADANTLNEMKKLVPKPKRRTKRKLTLPNEGKEDSELHVQGGTVDVEQQKDQEIGCVEIPNEETPQNPMVLYGPETQIKLAVGTADNIVAYGTAFFNDPPGQLCHGYPLGDANLRVSIDHAKEEKAAVPFPTEDIKTVRHAMGSIIPWPKELVIRLAPASLVTKPAGEKKKKMKIAKEGEDSAVVYDFASLASKVPPSLAKLCLWGDNGFKDGRVLNVDIHCDVFGQPRKAFLEDRDVHRIATMAEITGNCIVVYERYLYDVLSQSKRLDKVAFVHPAMIGSKDCGSAESRSRHIYQRMLSGKPGQLYMLPYNSGDHWVLTIVDPDQDTVYYLDPLRRCLPAIGNEWIPLVNSAMESYIEAKKADGTWAPPPKKKDQKESPTKKKDLKDTPLWIPLMGVPKQPDHIQCGFYVMRYMRDVIKDKDMSFVAKWERRTNQSYSQADIDMMRDEWADFVLTKCL